MILVGVIVLFGLFPALMVDLVQTASIPLIQGFAAMTGHFSSRTLFRLTAAGVFRLVAHGAANLRRDYLAAIFWRWRIGGDAGLGAAGGMLFFDSYRVDLFSQVFKVLVAAGFFLVVCLCSRAQRHRRTRTIPSSFSSSPPAPWR